MEKFIPQKEKEFKFPSENKGGDLSEEEIEQAKLYIAERKNDEPAEDKPLTEDDILKISSEKFSADESETKNFINFLKKKYEISKDNKMTRRNFLKITGAVVGLAIGYAYFKENIDQLWIEYQETIENDYEIKYSKDMTALYDEVEDLPMAESNDNRVSKNLENIDKNFKQAEFIKNSDKKNLQDLSEILIEENSDVVIFGEYHGPEKNAVNAVNVLDELNKKGNKKIAKICIEGLGYSDPESVKLIEQFNNRQISPADFQSKSYLRSKIKPLLEFAQNNNIPIEGIENDTKNGFNGDMERFSRISHKAASIAKNKNKDELIVIYAGASHTTVSNWNEDSTIDYLSETRTQNIDLNKEKENAEKKDYTLKEYLDEMGLKSTVVILKDLNYLSQINDHIMAHTSCFLNEKDSKKYPEEWKKTWNNFKTDRKEPFLIIPQSEKESYLLIEPSEISKIPPALNVFETIKNNYPNLSKIIQKNEYVKYQPIDYNMFLVSQTKKSVSAKMADVDLKSGKIKKLYLPEQLKEK